MKKQPLELAAASAVRGDLSGNRLRLSILWPTKGAAAFWFGLYSDGSKDGAVYHGGCPVISGSKWIVNKWINTFEQFSKYPCSRYRKVRVQPWDKSRFW